MMTSMDVLTTIGDGFKDAFLMAWAVWWALVFGFAISAIVQSWVPRERIENALGGSGFRPVAVATGLGAASSSCSYAAIAIAKSLFQKGASAASALAFQFSSTNLVVELGIVMWVLIGFLLAGFIGQLPNSFFNALFITEAPAGWKLIENAIVGPIIAILSFVCSVGNVPLAAVLWSGGISFAGVIAFIFADLIVVPIVLIYRKYYGNAYTKRIVALMFVTMVLAALIVDGLFSTAGLIPQTRPSRADIFSSIKIDYKLFTNIVGVAVFAALFALTMRRGVTDPVCGMKVDRDKALTNESGGHTYYFCSNHCLHAFEGRTDGLEGS
jgi:uncharacterized membrane protein YraQ (UPF0718 family)/YHS domain-containing protein